MILLIEDDYILAQSIKELLQLNGYEVEIRSSATSGIKFLKDYYPELIICDIILPDYDGFFILNFLRSNPRRDTIGFIFISAAIDSNFVIKGLKLGADDYLRKPFSVEELKLRVDNLIKKNKLLYNSYNAEILNEKRVVEIQANSKLDNFEFMLSKLILENLSNQKLDAKFLSKQFNLNQFNFNVLVKTTTGFTISEFIKKIRWNKSKELLFINRGDVYKTAQDLGFKNYNYFITKFKLIFGETPKHYYLRIIKLRM
jgi:DNA-binding response OmpR family regulator